MEDTLTIPQEEVQTEQEQVPQDPPSKRLYEGLISKGLYSKTYDEFEKQFSTPESISKLHNGLVSQKLYSKSSDDFSNQFFPTVKKKEDGSLPSVNGLPSTSKVEEVIPPGKLPSVKDKLIDYHDLIKKPVIPKGQGVNEPVSTEVVQPKITASYNDFIAHNEERTAKRKELRKEAVANAAMKVLKNKGVIKPEEEGKALNISQFSQLNTEKERLQEALDSGDATFAIKNGELGLKKTIGFLDALTKGWNQAIKANDDAANFVDMDAAQKVDYLKRQQAETEETAPSEYLGERPSAIGSIGQLAGENAPFLGKAIAGTATGTALIMAAPETAGASLAGLPAATAFLFTANDSKNQGIQSEVTRRFYQLKQENPEADEVELMKQAEQGTLAGGMAGILTNAALMSSVKTPLSNMAKGVVGKSITKAVGNAAYGGAATATIEGAKMAEASLEGIKTTPTEIAKDMGKTFSETATTLGLLHVMTGAVTGALTLPNIVKSAFKYALKDAKPSEIQNTLKANVEAGTITPETAEKVTTDLEQYKAAVAKTPNGLSPEAEASVAGLIQAKDKLIAEMKTKDDTAKPFYEEKIAAINEQIQKTVNTGKPYAHEIDEISGEKYTEQKPEEQPQPEVIEPSTEVKSEEVSNPALKDVDSTAKALLEQSSPTEIKNATGLDFDKWDEKDFQSIAETYHRDKLSGKETTVTKGIESILNKSETPQPSTVKSEEVSVSSKGDVVKEDLGAHQSFDSRTKYSIDGGVLEIGRVKGAKRFSVLSLEVDENKRRKGIATKLLKEAIRDTKGLVSGQASNDYAVDLNYKLGMRAYENGKELSLEETKKLRERQTSVNMRFSNSEFEKGIYELNKQKNIELDKIRQDNSSHNRAKKRQREEVNKFEGKLDGLTPKEISDKLIKSDLPIEVKKALVSKDFDKALQLTKSDEQYTREVYNEQVEKLEEKYPNINVPKNLLEKDKSVEPKSENKPIQQNKEVAPEIKKLETERDTKIKELEKVEVPKLEYVKEDDLVKMKNETELIEEQRGIKKREGQLKSLIKCLTGL